jgi:hypothetical protein
MLDLAKKPGIEELAAEVKVRLERVRDSLA